MRRFLTIFALIAMLGLQACMSVDSKLSVVQNGLTLVGDSGPVAIAQGDYDIQISIAKHASSPSTMTIKNLDQKFHLNLPDAKDLVDATRPVIVTSAELQQPVQMTFEREPDSDVDHYTLTIATQDGSTVLATAHFDFEKSSYQAFDENSQTFLMSFQDVKSSQRAAFIPIDGGLTEPMNGIVNHSAQILLAPWIYARYSNVKWFISGGDGGDEDLGKITDAVQSSPVIDLFAFNHGGEDSGTLDVAQTVGLKKNQVRLVYTEGCDSSTYLANFLSNYGAAVAIGHRATSASPLYSFGIVHFWTYGGSAYDAMMAGWIEGSTLTDLASFLTFGQMFNLDLAWSDREDMLHQSEPGVTWTSEMTPEKLNIDTSAVLKRNTPELSTAYLSFAGSYGKDVETTQLNGDVSRARP